MISTFIILFLFLKMYKFTKLNIIYGEYFFFTILLGILNCSRKFLEKSSIYF